MSKKPKGPTRKDKSGKDRSREDPSSEDRPREAGMKLDKASGGDPGPSPAGRSTMQPDTPHRHDHSDLQDGVAVIAPVTDAMMDHAAHEAAALADEVAHGTATVDRAAAAPAEAVARTAVEISDRMVGTMEEAARKVVEGAPRASDDAVEIAGSAAVGASHTLERGTDAARDALSASAGALSDYNATVLEMMRSNMASTTELFAALIQARSVPEALSINADHFRRRMEALTIQGRELATLAQRVAFDALQPFKGAADR